MKFWNTTSDKTKQSDNVANDNDDDDNNNMKIEATETMEDEDPTVEMRSTYMSVPGKSNISDEDDDSLNKNMDTTTVDVLYDSTKGEFVDLEESSVSKPNKNKKQRSSALLRTRVLQDWTKRERILLCIIAFNTILLIILMGGIMAVVNKMKHDSSNTSTTSQQLSAAETSDIMPWECWEIMNNVNNNDKSERADDSSNSESNTNLSDTGSDNTTTDNTNNDQGSSSSNYSNTGTTTTTTNDQENSATFTVDWSGLGSNSNNDNNDDPPSTTTTTTEEGGGTNENDNSSSTTTGGGGGDGSSSTNNNNNNNIPNIDDLFVGDPGELCGCASCTESIWTNMAGEFTCGDRISYLTNDLPTQYPTQIHACRRVAFEFPCECGACDPGRCNLPTPEFIPPSNWIPPTGNTPAPTPVTAYTDPSIAHIDQELYCFPPPSLRTTYTLWDNMQVQIKESASVCGPGNNAFTGDTVLINESSNELTLLYKNNQASEVRIVLPEDQRPFTYGTYRFSVKSIQVKSEDTGAVISNVLPKELVLGLFTWDDTEKYAIHENYNHEVDIEISRWNCETNSDLQYLVQPPGSPQLHRLFTGNPSAVDNIEERYKQGGHTYEFTWNPGQIDWETSTGSTDNNKFVLKTSETVYRELPDYVQCLPDIGGNMEVRINLWNMLGAKQLNGLSSTDYVEVVIDNFTYEPNGNTHIDIGGICSKHCQCEADVAACINNICTSIV